MRFLLFPFLSFLLAGTGLTQTAPKESDWNGFKKLDFVVADRPCLLVQPEHAAKGSPWIWRTEFFGNEPQGDLALLKAGWSVAYIKVSDMYGAPQALDLMAKFQDALVARYGLARRAVLEGFSRGGLYAVNYAAAYPDRVAALYLDAPVLDLKSWPGGKGKGKGTPGCWQQALAIYGLNEESAMTFKGNPVDKADVVAKAKIPIIAVCGDADEVVPYSENTGLFKERFEAAGGKINVILKPGGNHHPHSLKDPKPIVDFLVSGARWE